MPIIIKKMKTERNWMYLWGKYVNGVNLEKHCARSLLGKYSKKIKKYTKDIENLILDESRSEIFYLCGVTKPYVWKDNFHLALKYKEGCNIKINRNNIYLEIENAEELPINFDINNCEHENKTKEEYSTCRNWQFAFLYKDMIKEGEK